MQHKQNLLVSFYPSSKFLFALLISISVFLVPNYLYAYLMLPLCAILAWCAGKGKEFVVLTFKSLLIIVTFIFIIQSIFVPGEEILWSWGFLSINKEGVEFSLELTSRIVAIGSAFMLFFRITPIKDIVYALEEAKMSPKFTYVFLSIFQIIPEVNKLSKNIMDAQRARGVETEGNLFVRAKAFIPVLGPLILGSIASTEERAVTLEVRAFSAKRKKTSLHTVSKSTKDTVTKWLFVLLLIFFIIGRLFIWN